MKHARKLAGILLAMVMALALALPAFADETANDNGSTNTSNTVEISAPAGSTRTYDVYQIFTGTLSENKVLSDVKWGRNAKLPEGTVVGDTVSDTVLKSLTDVNNSSDTEKLAVIEDYVDFDSQAIGTVSKEKSLFVVTGYYLIKDNGPLNDGEAYSLYVVQIVGPTTISPKVGTVTSEKKIKDINDTTDSAATGWQDSADYDIGDKIPFQLKGVVADDYANYTTYYFAFHDVEERGLTFDSGSVKVYVDGNQITTGYEVVLATNMDEEGKNKISDGCTFEVIFNNLKEIQAVHAGSEITVEYESTLNEHANVGDQGNVNKAKLEYSNNPNNHQVGKHETGETPWDNVIVFTYKVVINKVDGENKALTGAEFTLTKELKDGTEKNIAVVKSDNGTKFSFSGLDDGKYTLTETKTPDGYNTISPITFTVNADHNISWDGTNRNAVLTNLTGNKVTGEITFTPDKANGSLTADVVNNAGSTLPSTGGIGTTIFYVVGSILVLAAVVLLITKKRMSEDK